MRKKDIRAAIDIGTSKVCTLVGSINDIGQVEILGMGSVPSRGMKKGIISSVSEVMQVTKESIHEAERQSGVKISSAYIGLTGNHIRSVNARAVLENRRYDMPIGSREIDRILDACSNYGDYGESKTVHVIPRDYALDGFWGVVDPVGMFSSKVEVESHVIQGGFAPIDNLVKAVGKAKVKVNGMVLETLASAECVLAKDEKDMGIVLVDIGGGTTDICVFLDGSVWHTGVLPVGGFNFTRDLSVLFNTSMDAAEEVKLSFGDLSMNEIAAEELIEIPALGRDRMQKVSRVAICDMLKQRMQELLGMIAADIKEAGMEKLPPGGLVLTGGSSKFSGLEYMARNAFGSPVRIGVPTNILPTLANMKDPSMSTVVGLLAMSLGKVRDFQWKPKGASFDYLNVGQQILRNVKMSFNGMNKRVQQQLRRYDHG